MTGKQIIALLVGINGYPDRPLNGCLNDVADVHSYLTSFSTDNTGLNLQIKTLTDSQATRTGIIEAFSIFEAAGKDDVCLFYFSGHGSQFEAPKEFWSETDKMNETLICYGPQDGSNLLVDKELSFLIARAVNGKDLHFLVVTDCCHGGSNTKDAVLRVRSAPVRVTKSDPKSYWGFEQYAAFEENGEQRYSPPIGGHIHLSACLDSQLAKEGDWEGAGITRGVFTYALFKTLREYGAQTSYANLQVKTDLLLRTIARNQSPQLTNIGQPDSVLHKTFLSGSIGALEPFYSVTNHRLFGWIVEAGAMQGFTEDHRLQVFMPGQPALETGLTKVFDHYSWLRQGDFFGIPRDKIWNARAIIPVEKRLNIAYSPDCAEEGKLCIGRAISQLNPTRFRVQTGQTPDFLIRTIDQAFVLTHPNDKSPVFRRVEGFNDASALVFVQAVEQVARWKQIIGIHAPVSEIGEEQLEIVLSRVAKPYLLQYRNGAPVTPVQDWSRDTVFRYNYDENFPGNDWHAPAFQLTVRNKSDKQLWIGGLYCGSGYGQTNTGEFYSVNFEITDRFQPAESVGPGQSVNWTDQLADLQSSIVEQDSIPQSYLGDQSAGSPAVKPEKRLRQTEIKSIRLGLLEDYFDLGYNEIKDLIKIFVSTESFSTTDFCQTGLPVELPERTRKKSEPPQMSRPRNWRTFEIPITIVQPRIAGLIGPDQTRSFYGVTVNEHPTFKARIMLSTMEELIRGTRQEGDKVIYMPRPERFWDNAGAEVIPFGPALGEVEGLAVIELYVQTLLSTVTPEAPLVLEYKNRMAPAGKEHWIAGYEEKNRSFIPLAQQDTNGIFYLTQLPEPSVTPVEGLGNSVKLFFVVVMAGQLNAWKPVSVPA